MIRVALFDGDCASFIREKFPPFFVSAAIGQCDRGRRAAPAGLAAMALPPGNHEHDLAFRGMGFVMCKQLAGSAAAELFEFFC